MKQAPTVPAPAYPTCDPVGLPQPRRALGTGAPSFQACVGRYRVEEEIGRGAMGVVYRAFDVELERPVALKLHRLHARAQSLESLRDRLLREARALARISHPAVIGVHDVGVIDEQVFVAMEYVRGQDLEAWLKTPRGPREIVDVFIQVAEGLDAAHRAGVIHRDVKPNNVIVDADGRARVVDFGVSKSLVNPGPSITGIGMVMGTPVYMAPEQARDEIAPASDQFSLSVCLWEALAGELPFSKDPWKRARELEAGVAPRGQVPIHFEEVLRKGMAPRPQDRFPSMGALAAALRQALRPRRGHKRWLSTGIVVTAVMALAIASVQAQQDRSRAEHAVYDDFLESIGVLIANGQLEAADRYLELVSTVPSLQNRSALAARFWLRTRALLNAQGASPHRPSN